jgi:hypothetical protein
LEIGNTNALNVRHSNIYPLMVSLRGRFAFLHHRRAEHKHIGAGFVATVCLVSTPHFCRCCGDG